MLTPASASIVASTLPVVRAHAESITGVFYDRMFAAHPDLLNLFNRGNQANGRQRQALAAAVVGYAEHLTGHGHPGWTSVVERIAHKHASLGIAPAHYTIVGQHLLAAVGEVLGEAVTAPVAAAWDEVYWRFACELVAREARLYHTVGVEDPATIWRRWRVTGKTAETDDVVSLTLAPDDGRPAPGFTPGQYVSVAVDLGPADRQIRQYSLSGRPGEDTWRITVKRVRASGSAPAGAVSTHLHTRTDVGGTLLLSPPFGEVSSVAGSGPLLLVSAGIGVTPAMAALEHLAGTATERPVIFVHADRASTTHALRGHLPRLSRSLSALRVHLWYEAVPAGETAPATRVHHGFVDPGQIPVPPDAHVHLCGPLPFMAQVRGGLLRRGVPAERIAYEVFGPEMLHA